MHRRVDARRAAPLALLALLALTGCNSSEGSTPAPSGSPLALFRKVRCSSCHGLDAEGIPRMGPPLHDISANWTQDELERYILDPAPFRRSKPHLKELSLQFFAHMRAFPELSAAKRTTLALWLLER